MMPPKKRIFAAVCMAAALSFLIPSFTQAQEAGRPMGGARGMMPGGPGGPSISGTVTAVGADSITIQSDTGETYKVTLSSETRVIKDRQQAKASDLKVGDTIMAGGKIEESTKTVTAGFISVIDPERAKRMKEMQANYGKTWLSGKITAIQETKITVTGRQNATYTIVVDENTSLKKRRDSITLADIKVGDSLMAKGAMKDGAFAATEIELMGSGGMGGPGRPGGWMGGSVGSGEPPAGPPPREN